MPKNFIPKAVTQILQYAADTISEITSGAGVTVDGVLLKDSQVSTDQINEKTSAAGVTIDGVLVKDNTITAFRESILTKSADYTLTAADSGKTVVMSGVDKVLTLPATTSGLHYKIVLAAAGLSSGTGLSISPNSADKIMGNGFTSADDKDAILAGSGDREGDMIELVGDGVDGWYILNVVGTWTRQA